MADILKKFGRYFLLDQIAQGGMAELYRARLATKDGPGRLLVIKKIQTGYGSNNEFLQMFKSEIKVTMGFNHPNIVQLYDFGDEAGQPFIAMEFVDGRNLRQVLSRYAELKKNIPVEAAAFIIEQAACGLHYAHSFKDKITGESLSIVHRDVSPQNVLIGYEGNVKVIDFGIAKATTNLESTRAGVIKGKPSYLSPEQITGEKLDGRCDIFALGIVFWELLVGRKLFAGENDLAVLKLIESSQSYIKPPSAFNPAVPKELDLIVLRALARQREKRFQSAEELQRALHKFLNGFSADFSISDLSVQIKDIFKSDIVEDRKQVQRLNDQAEQLLVVPEVSNNPFEVFSEKPEASVPVSPFSDEERETTTMVGKPKPAIKTISANLKALPAVEIEPSFPNGRPSGAGYQQRTKSFSRPIPAPPPEEKPFRLGYVLTVAAAITAIFVMNQNGTINLGSLFNFRSPFSGSGNASGTRLLLKGNQKGVTVTLNGQVVGDSLPLSLNDVPANTPFHVTVTGPNGTFEQNINLERSESRELTVALTPAKITSPDKAKAMIALRLNLSPSGGPGTVTLNGKALDINNPVIQVPLDEPLELSIDKEGFRHFQRQFVLESAQNSGLAEKGMEVSLEPEKFGFLTIRSTPSATVTIAQNGHVINQGRTPAEIVRTPTNNLKLAVGTYNIKLSNDVLGMEKTVTVSVEDSRIVSIDERLEIKN